MHRIPTDNYTRGQKGMVVITLVENRKKKLNSTREIQNLDGCLQLKLTNYILTLITLQQ
jgi:hypothetical protein